MTDPTRTPYCHKIRYGISGAPTLTGDEMQGSHAPGVGMSPRMIEVVHSAARDGRPAAVMVSVTGEWTVDGRPGSGEVTAHFEGDPSGWPVWLAEEARGALAAVPVPSVDRAALRQRVAAALAREDAHNAGYDHGFVGSYGADEETDGFVDAVLDAVLPAPADRAAVLRWAADRLWALANRTTERGQGVLWAAEWLRRMAAEAQPVHVCKPGANSYYCPTSGQTESDCHGGFTTCCDRPDLHQPTAEAQPATPDTEPAPQCTAGLLPATSERVDRCVRHGKHDSHVTASGVRWGKGSNDEPAGSAAKPETDTPTETVHDCPPPGSSRTPCCNRLPWELPLTDRISSEKPATCSGRPS
ncbi:hypothetical protein [Streptomyces fumanus]|uniref:Uncharacterized protein n=1 Tax=Streptomyces fumanus TaxID=67302 RepID=A0A919DVE4_9ACTN|nr:hypothetical protein [Streptomyces fumanus]GHE84904.1 hypothetical protein GCM10018772_05020 [Streptomyces fumanus]